MTDKKGNTPIEAGENRETGMKVRWDDADARVEYANVFNVGSTREEVFLSFGVNQGLQGNQEEVVVRITNRIMLSPYAAKRLSMMLSQAMDQYEQRFGKLEAIEK